MKDIIYQEALKNEVDKFILQPVDTLKTLNDYGSIIVDKDSFKINIGWWKYEVNKDTFHFVFKTSRRSLLIFRKPFLDGIKIIENKIERLVGRELGEYD